MVKRLAVLVAVLFAFSCIAVAAGRSAPGAVPRPIPKTLHVGSHGKRVKALQWLLSGHKPVVFHRWLYRTYHGRIDGIYGRTTAIAVRNEKLRLGYKKPQATTAAGVMLLDLLLGKQAQTLQMVSRAAIRLRAIAVYESKLRKYRSSCTYRELSTARGQIGVHEIPWGSNRGPGVSYSTSHTNPAFQSITFAWGAAWCASFVQWDLWKSGLGTIANRSAGVYYIKDWAVRHFLKRPIAHPGYLVAFINGAGHIGIVERVTHYGIYSIEGNEGNAVRRVYHGWRSINMVFIKVPNCGA